MIKAVFFDLDGTLRHNLPSGGEFFADHAIRLGLGASDEDRLRALRWEHLYWANSPEMKADMAAYKDENAFWSMYARRQLVALGASNEEADLLAPKMHEHMASAYKPQSVVPADAMHMLGVLKDAGYTLALISNRERPYDEEAQTLGLAPFFDLLLAGGQLEMRKPEPEIFLHACQRLNVEPAQAAYVGDNYFADVVGSRRAGLQPVLYDPRGIFVDPGCTTIRSFEELPGVLQVAA